MNAFDLVVTVALGSTFASVLLSKDVPLADGLFALTLLVAPVFGSVASRSLLLRSADGQGRSPTTRLARCVSRKRYA
ncbi:MAG: hypothetical protein ABJF23_27840 [Bryobacteraceae bacterium]